VLLVVGGDGLVGGVNAGLVEGVGGDYVEDSEDEGCTGAVGYGLQDGVDGWGVAGEQEAGLLGHDYDFGALAGEALGVGGVGGDEGPHGGGLLGEDDCVGVEESYLDGLLRSGCGEAEGAEEDGRGDDREGRGDDWGCVREVSAAEIESGGDGGGEQQQEEGDAPGAGERGDLQDGEKALLRVGEAAGGAVGGGEAGEVFG